MTTAYRRPKNPDAVRRSLLDCAARLALEQGLAAVKIKAVAEAAGVTTGALFHHFEGKQALIEAVFADLLSQADAEIDAAMAKDPDPDGAFTRAYVVSIFSDPMLTTGGQWAALHVSMIAEPALRRLWAEWFAERLGRHRDTDDRPELEVVRLAADGAWLAFLMHEEGGPLPDLAALSERLVAMTRPPASS